LTCSLLSAKTFPVSTSVTLKTVPSEFVAIGVQEIGALCMIAITTIEKRLQSGLVDLSPLKKPNFEYLKIFLDLKSSIIRFNVTPLKVTIVSKVQV
jgi:hypothetical protein